MATSGKGVVMKAKKLELQALEKYKIAPERLLDLDELLDDVFLGRRPSPIDYEHRRQLVRIFNVMAKELYGNSPDAPVVDVFGSFVMDMFSPGSDLDLSVNFSSCGVEVPRQKRIQTIRKFAKKFHSLQRGGHVSGIQVITTARVPIVKVIDQGTGVECDLSVENRDGILKSQVIYFISLIDERFQKLSLLMKAWAKAHGINSSKDNTLNSLSIISLVAFHLQTRDPPILPPFAVLFKDGMNPSAVLNIVQSYKGYGKGNKESVGQLFVTLFIKMASIGTIWQKGLCASLYEASWIFKTDDSEIGPITVEDFTDRSQNVARAVSTQGFRKIYSVINISLNVLLAFMDGEVQRPRVRDTLFSMDGVTSRDGFEKNLNGSTPDILIRQDSHQMKKRRLTGCKNKEAANDWGGELAANRWAGAQIMNGREQTIPSEDWGSNLGGSQFAQGWERTLPAEGLRGKLVPNGWVEKQQSESGEGYLQGNGWIAAQQVDGWGRRVNATVNGWGRKRQLDDREGMSHVDGWVGRPQVGGWEQARQTNGGGRVQKVDGWGQVQQVDGWEVLRQNNGEPLKSIGEFTPLVPPINLRAASGVDSRMSPLPTNRPIGLEGSNSESIRPHLVTPQNSLALGASHSVNSNILLPPTRQFLPHRAHSNYNQFSRR